MRTRLPSAVAVLLALSSVPAFAQATRTWVSGVGDDANPCSRTAPCKTFAGAISKTAAGGEIDALDPGGFGNVTVTKSMTIDGGPGAGGILNFGTSGVIVNVNENDVVILRNLNFSGAGNGIDGIRFIGTGTLIVENCHIVSGTRSGIDFSPATGKEATARLILRNVTVSGYATGVQVAGGAASIERSQVMRSGVGIDVSGMTRVSIYDTVISSNTNVGLRAQAGSEVNVERGVLALNGTGVDSAGRVRLSEVMLSHNTTGLNGNVISFGNNRVAAGNGTDGAPSSTIPQQ